ncbi:MAG: hypothetical protein ABI210_07150, partial [Abditibacteriaceae bacterium]
EDGSPSLDNNNQPTQSIEVTTMTNPIYHGDDFQGYASFELKGGDLVDQANQITLNAVDETQWAK